MFGFSLQKLLLLAAVIGAVWYGFKLVSRLQEARQLDQSARAKPRPAKPGRRRSNGKGEGETEEAEEMVRCPACDAFVAARVNSNCGRRDCPY